MTQFPIEQAIDFFQSRAVRVRIRGDMLDIALTALRQHQQGGGWLQIEGEMQGNFVVTNNINARDNTGKMSHIWYTPFIQESSEPRIYGKYICFDDADRKIHGLTHYYAIPAPKKENDDA